jgi:tRNA A37 threonylcarbamoyladenosine modification protein TsaB
MINLIIDAANEKIVFVIITDEQSYTTSHINSRENFDNFMKLLLKFLKKIKIKISDINRIFVNLGPGKFTSLRISLSIAKAISLANKTSLVGFKSSDLINKNYKNLIKIDKKKLQNKDLIKPIYSS